MADSKLTDDDLVLEVCHDLINRAMRCDDSEDDDTAQDCRSEQATARAAHLDGARCAARGSAA